MFSLFDSADSYLYENYRNTGTLYIAMMKNGIRKRFVAKNSKLKRNMPKKS